MTDKISVLLLDDEKGPLATVKDVIEVDGRFRVKTFDSYKEAIVYTLKKRDIDVMVTDHRMKDPKKKIEDWSACHVADDIFNLDNTIKVLVYTAYFNEFKESLFDFYEQKKDFIDSKNFNDFYEKRIFLTVDKRESIDELVIKILRAA